MPRLLVATRGSRLARIQTDLAVRALAAAVDDLDIDVVDVQTEGDERPEPLTEIGGKGVFVKGVDDRVLAREADLAVHSLKDMPTALHEDLVIAAVLPRGPAHDVLVGGHDLETLREGARVGTSSPRRKAQVLHERPDLRIVPLRGNVPTRLASVGGDGLDAVVLAAAGLERLEVDVARHDLDLVRFPTAPGQGAIAVTARRGSKAEDLARRADDAATRAAVEAERTVLRTLGQGCMTPMGCTAVPDDGGYRIVAELFDVEGARRVRLERRLPGEGTAEAASAFGRDLVAEGGYLL